MLLRDLEDLAGDYPARGNIRNTLLKSKQYARRRAFA